jgi:uncharacterized membrane protein AbrB (regulator of aidB expression)
MRRNCSWFISAQFSLAAAVAAQIASQLAASAAARAMSAGLTGGHANIADVLSLLGMAFAGIGVAFWFTSSIKQQTPTHAVPLAILALYAVVFLILV